MTLEDMLEAHGLETVGILQQTKAKMIQAVQNPDGEKFVVKWCYSPNTNIQDEANFLRSVESYNFEYLEIPRVIDSSPSHILMTWVERESHNRVSVLSRTWTDAEIDTLCRGVLELQTIPVPSAVDFGFQRRAMGMAYPVFRLLLQTKAGWLKPSQITAALRLMIGYLINRPRFSNVTTHYDLTNQNCAFTDQGQVSILDFEFHYAGGDPHFDILYFITIPAVRLKDWTFQQRILQRYLAITEDVAARQRRMRFILLVCCIARLGMFKPDSAETAAYRANIELLLNGQSFKTWWQSLSDGTAEQ